MNKLTRFMGAIGKASSDIDRYFLRNIPGGDDRAVLDDPYSNNSLVYTCISTTARAIAQVPLMVVEYDKRENPVPVAPQHPWQKLLNQPNYMMNRGAFLEAIFSLWLLDGNVCIIPFPPLGSNKGVPSSLWVVRWKYMKYDMDDKGHLKKWYYRPAAGTSIPLDPSEVLHLKFFNPNDSIAGLAPSEAGRIPIQSLHRASQYNAQFFENGAVPGGILHTDKQLSKTTFDRTKQQVNQDYGVKQGNAQKLMVLEQGLKWAATGISQRDMEFIGLHKLNAEEILQLYGMKKSIISITGDLNFATATVERKEWWQGTCMPLMRLFVDTLSFGLFEQRGLDTFDLLFDISSIEALHEAFADKAKTSEILLRLGFTRNEVNRRLEMGFPDVKWGNIAYMPVNMMPVNIPGMPPQGGGPGGADGPNPNPQNPQANPPAGNDTPTQPEETPKGVRSIEQEARLNERWKALMHLTGSFEDQMLGKVKRIFFEMRKNTLELWNTSGAINDLESRSYDLEKGSFLKYVAPILTEVVKQGAQSIMDENTYNSDEDQALDFTGMCMNFLLTRELTLRGIIETVKSHVLDNVRQALLENSDPEKAIKDAFNSANARAKTIARTEVMSAFNHGRHEVIARSAFSLKEWYTPNAESGRHSEMNGKTIGVRELWLMPDGYQMSFPCDPAGGIKNCVNCRCVEFIVTNGG